MLLTAKYIIPVTSPFIEDGAVLVRGTRIADVGTAQELKEKYPDEEVRDFGLAALSPGFVNAHTHLRYTALRGLFDDVPYDEWKRSLLRCEPLFKPSDWVNSARLGALEALASGITTIADITIPGATLQAVKESGLRAVIYREVLSMKAERAQIAVDLALKDIERWSAEVEGSDRVTFGLAGGPVYTTHPAVYKAIAKHVGDSDMPVAMHLAGSQEECDFIRYGSSSFSIHASNEEQGFDLELPPWLPSGVSPVRYVYNWDIFDCPNMLVVHGVHVDEDDLDILKKQDVSVAYCPRINAKLSMGCAPIEDMLEKGITVGLGTDSPAAVDTTDIIDEMRVGLLISRAVSRSRKKHMSAETMLRMATLDAAKALHMDDEIGSLEVGKKADIIAIDLHNSHQNPTSNPSSAVIYTANQDNVEMTMVDGKILYENFTHVSDLHRDLIVEEARNIRQRVRQGMNDSSLHVAALRELAEDVAQRLRR